MTKAQSKVAVPPGNVVTRSVSNVTVCEPVEEVKMVSPEQPIPGGSGGGGGGGGGKIALASCTATAKGRPLHISGLESQSEARTGRLRREPALHETCCLFAVALDDAPKSF